MTDKPENSSGRWIEGGNRRIIAIVVGVGVLAGSAFAVQAFAQSKTYAHMKLYTSDDAGVAGDDQVHYAGWGGGRRHGKHGDFSKLTDTEIEAKITRLVKHAGIEIDATPEQEAQIIALVTPVAVNMKTMRGEMRETGQELHALLSAPVIDRAALEELRAQKLAEADEISKEWVGVIADVAMVLTAEQRQVLEERMEEFRGMRGGWHRR